MKYLSKFCPINLGQNFIKYISFLYWAMEFQEKMLLRFTDLCSYFLSITNRIQICVERRRGKIRPLVDHLFINFGVVDPYIVYQGINSWSIFKKCGYVITLSVFHCSAYPACVVMLQYHVYFIIYEDHSGSKGQ